MNDNITDNNPDKIYTEAEARELGFPVSRSALLAAGVSSATLGRRIKDMTANVDYIYVKGKTRPTPHFPAAAWEIFGIYTGEAVADADYEMISPGSEPGAIATGLSDENFSPRTSHENNSQALVRSSPIISRSSQNNLTAEAAVMLLLGKPFLTIDEAAHLTPFTKSHLHSLSEMIGGRRVIRRSKIDKL